MKTYTINYEIHCHITDRVERDIVASYNAETLGKAFEAFTEDYQNIVSQYYIDYEPTDDAFEYGEAKRRADESALDLEDIATPEEIKLGNEEMADINILVVM